MSHQYTRQEIDNAKIQILVTRIGNYGIKICYDELYHDAIELLNGNAVHTYEGDPNKVEQPDPLEKLDG